jgi:hypothetical protein
MPCIICKKERWSILRIPLEVMTETREHYFREAFFTNFEFDHVCRFCSLKDFLVGSFINTLGFILNMAMRGWLIALGVLICYAFCLKFGLQGRAAEVLPVLGGLFVAGILGVRAVRWFFFATGGLALLAALIAGLMYSDMFSIMPDVSAMMNREKLHQGGEILVTQEQRDAYVVHIMETQGLSRKAAMSIPFDPIEASKARASKARWDRLVGAATLAKRFSPVAVEMTLDQFKIYLKLAGITLALYLVLVTLSAWLLGDVAREAERKRRGKQRSRV